MKCNSCNQELPQGAKFCPYCGEKINAEAVCPHCATKLPQGAAYCSNCGQQVTEQSSPVETIELGNDFLIGLYENFWADWNKKLTEYCESKNLHEMVRILSRYNMSHLIERALSESYRFVKQSFGQALTGQAENNLNALYEERQRELSKNTEPLLIEMDSLGARIKEELPATNMEGQIKDFVGSFVKGAVGGWLGAAQAFLDGNTEEKRQQSLLEDWDSHVSAMMEQVQKLWEECTEDVDTLIAQCPVQPVWEDGVLTKYLEEKSGVKHDLLPSLQEVASSDDLYFTPDIPDEKLGEAKRSYASLDEDEVVLCLFDSTVFGGADDGALFTNKGIYWREFLEDPQYVNYSDLDSVFYMKSKNQIKLKCKNGKRLTMSFSSEENEMLLPMLRKIIEWAAR